MLGPRDRHLRVRSLLDRPESPGTTPLGFAASRLCGRAPPEATQPSQVRVVPRSNGAAPCRRALSLKSPALFLNDLAALRGGALDGRDGLDGAAAQLEVPADDLAGAAVDRDPRLRVLCPRKRLTAARAPSVLTGHPPRDATAVEPRDQDRHGSVLTGEGAIGTRGEGRSGRRRPPAPRGDSGRRRAGPPTARTVAALLAPTEVPRRSLGVPAPGGAELLPGFDRLLGVMAFFGKFPKRKFSVASPASKNLRAQRSVWSTPAWCRSADTGPASQVALRGVTQDRR
jgi:hypothetical protein